MMTSNESCSSRSNVFASVTTPVSGSTEKYCPDIEYFNSPFSGSIPEIIRMLLLFYVFEGLLQKSTMK